MMGQGSIGGFGMTDDGLEITDDGLQITDGP